MFIKKINIKPAVSQANKKKLDHPRIANGFPHTFILTFSLREQQYSIQFKYIIQKLSLEIPAKRWS